MEKKMTSIGGQAIIEGVMMRGPKKIAMAVRKPDGEIIIEEKEAKGIGKWSRLPILRGVVSFISSMVVGVQALMFSAKFFDIEEEESEKDKKKAEEKALKKAKKEAEKRAREAINKEIVKETVKNENDLFKESEKKELENSKNEYKWKEKNDGGNGLSDVALYLTVFISLIFSIGLFMLIPNFVADLIVPDGMTALYNVVENVVKISIFMIYLLAVSQMEDIKRVFEYHGAEHKSIFCYESGEELTVENVKKHTRFHPRCGTSFLLFVIIISIIFFSCLPRFENVFTNMAIRLLLMPIVAGVSYEIIKFAGKSKNKCVMLLNKPGMWLQRLTTREPDDAQIEVAIASLKAVIPENGEEDKW